MSLLLRRRMLLQGGGGNTPEEVGYRDGDFIVVSGTGSYLIGASQQLYISKDGGLIFSSSVPSNGDVGFTPAVSFVPDALGTTTEMPLVVGIAGTLGGRWGNGKVGIVSGSSLVPKLNVYWDQVIGWPPLVNGNTIAAPRLKKILSIGYKDIQTLVLPDTASLFWAINTDTNSYAQNTSTSSVLSRQTFSASLVGPEGSDYPSYPVWASRDDDLTYVVYDTHTTSSNDSWAVSRDGGATWNSLGTLHGVSGLNYKGTYAGAMTATGDTCLMFCTNGVFKSTNYLVSFTYTPLTSLFYSASVDNTFKVIGAACSNEIKSLYVITTGSSGRELYISKDAGSTYKFKTKLAPATSGSMWLKCSGDGRIVFVPNSGSFSVSQDYGETFVTASGITGFRDDQKMSVDIYRSMIAKEDPTPVVDDDHSLENLVAFFTEWEQHMTSNPGGNYIAQFDSSYPTVAGTHFTDSNMYYDGMGPNWYMNFNGNNADIPQFQIVITPQAKRIVSITLSYRGNTTTILSQTYYSSWEELSQAIIDAIQMTNFEITGTIIWN